jgi:membrane associated rhomboid family serine protease
MFSFLNNIPQVTKNLLILNVLMYLLTLFFETRGVDLGQMLGAHYVNSPLFEPYQIVSHFFMHGSPMHILFNMFALVTFGGFLERLWGPKRFFIVYLSAAIGAFALYNAIGVYQLIQLKHTLAAQGFDIQELNEMAKQGLVFKDPVAHALTEPYLVKCVTPMVGASGAVFGLLAAFAILFPNTELQLMLPPVPVKAKYLIGGYFILEVLLSYYQVEGDHVAHLAHVGGALVGGIFVLFWRRNRTNFY